MLCLTYPRRNTPTPFRPDSDGQIQQQHDAGLLLEIESDVMLVFMPDSAPMTLLQ
jgi:hypothetical protein